jgi:IS30 family transposase
MQAFSDKLLASPSPCQSTTYDQAGRHCDAQGTEQRTGMAVASVTRTVLLQRGSNENTNGLVRWYPPKGTDLSGHSQEQPDATADQINRLKGLPIRWRRSIDNCS